MDYITAVDEIFSLFNSAWSLQTSSIVGYVPDIRWQGVEKNGKPDSLKYWARVSQQTVIEEQATISFNNGRRRYRSKGLVFVELFCPKSDPAAMEKGRRLAVVARNCFRGKATYGKVWFRNVTIKELAPEETIFRINVISEYEYDEMTQEV